MAHSGQPGCFDSVTTGQQQQLRAASTAGSAAREADLRDRRSFAVKGDIIQSLGPLNWTHLSDSVRRWFGWVISDKNGQ